MTTRFTYSLIAIAIISGLSGNSTWAAVLDSSSFNHQYNGDVYNNPGLPNYTQGGAFNTPAPSTDGNILTYRVPGGGGYFESTDWAAASKAALTIEFRIRVGTETGEATKGAILVLYGNGSAGDGFSVGQNSVWAGIGATNVLPGVSNTDDYHTFRIAMEEDGGGPANPTIRMWRDGTLIHTWNNGGNYASNYLSFGSNGSTYGGPTIQLDYFRWDNTGAWEPPVIPEPSSLSLISAAGLLWMRRR